MAEDDDVPMFRINKDYAERYNNWREKEELQKLKDRYGDDVEAGTSSSEESEDEDAEALTSQVEKDWLKTLAALKSKDPKIYDKNATFYQDEGTGSSEDEETDTKKKEKPMFLKDYERKVILEKEGKISSSEDESDEEQLLRKNPSYFEEQEEIRKSLKSAAAAADSEDEDLLVERKKTIEEEEAEEEEYRAWLKGHKETVEHDAEVVTQLEPLKKHWSNPNLGEGEKFLRDYILNKRYIDEDDDERIPTYNEIVNGDDSPTEDEQILTKQNQFERKYNFRFEEPDDEFIKSYPRTVGDSVRRKDDRRARKRTEAKERKEQIKRQKREELKQLKNLKRREIMAKIERLKEITGNETIGFTDADIEDDFDPQKYDKLMQKVFDKGYYNENETEKPTFEDDPGLELETDNWDEWTGLEEAGPSYSEPGPSGYEEEYYEPHCEDPDFNMDDDYDPDQDQSHTMDHSKRQKKSKFKQALERQKPVFDPNEKTFEEYFDEFYKLDYEDIIGDLPCRFKYRQVTPNDYGLNIDEVLQAKDKELNAWVSLKKMSQYMTEEEEHHENRAFAKKARNTERKTKILASLQEMEEDPQTDTTQQKKKKKRKKKKNASTLVSVGSKETAPTETLPQSRKRKNPAPHENRNEETKRPKHHEHENQPERKKKKKKAEDAQSNETTIEATHQEGVDPKVPNKDVPANQTNLKPTKKKKKHKAGTMTDERLKAYGINPKKFKYEHLPKIKQQQRDSKKTLNYKVK